MGRGGESIIKLNNRNLSLTSSWRAFYFSIRKSGELPVKFMTVFLINMLSSFIHINNTKELAIMCVQS